MEKRHRKNGAHEHAPNDQRRPVAQVARALCASPARGQNPDARRAVRGRRLRTQVCHQTAGGRAARAQRAGASWAGAALRAHRAGGADDLAGRRTALWQTAGPGPAAVAAARPAPSRQTQRAPAGTAARRQSRHARPAAWRWRAPRSHCGAGAAPHPAVCSRPRCRSALAPGPCPGPATWKPTAWPAAGPAWPGTSAGA